MKGALIGCGFFARNHMHAWRELPEVEIAAVCDLDEGRATAMAEDFGIARKFADPEEMLRAVQPDFVDIVTKPDTHAALVELAVSHRVPVICQKPMAPDMETAQRMVRAAEAAGIPFMVHENFRWQPAMRALRRETAAIGAPFFGRISFRSGYDVYADQPYLATDARFILYDLGVHLLDLARFFLGEVVRLSCHTQRVNPRINGEDVATVVLEMRSGATCIVDMSYASTPEKELFPQTLVHLEGPGGTVSLGADFAVTAVTAQGVRRTEVPAPRRGWSTTGTSFIADSVVAAQSDWLHALGEGRPPETHGADNLRTLELVFGAYQAAESGRSFFPEVPG